MNLKALIEKSYSKEQADNLITDDLTNDQLLILKNCCTRILQYFPPQPLSCAYMSALWVDMAREHGIQAYLAAGTLDLYDKRLFDYDNRVENSDFVNGWNGHCWAIFNNTIGDSSLFRTAYSNIAPKWLQDLVISEFGKNRGAILGNHDQLNQDGLRYSVRYIFNDYQIEGLLNSAARIVSEHRKIDKQLKEEDHFIS